MLGGVDCPGIQGCGRHPGAWGDVGSGGDVGEAARAVVAEQEVFARAPSEPAAVFAVAARMLYNRH